MSKKDHMDFKLFSEKINSLLAEANINELKNIIKSLAEDTLPAERKEFIEKIINYRTKPAQNIDVNAPKLILKIADIKKEIKIMAQKL
jgi:hypothetical protein